LKHDNRAIFTAAGQAQCAAEFLNRLQSAVTSTAILQVIEGDASLAPPS